MNIIPTAQFLGPSPLHIGDYYEGGIIAYLTGSFPNQTGFVVSQDWVPTIDVSELGYAWGVLGDDVAGASGSAIGTGAINTQYILDYYGSGNTYAAQVAVTYTADGYSGWFLPSKDELNEICGQFVAGKLNKGNWVSPRLTWSSTQYSTGNSWYYDIRTNVTSCNGGGRTPFTKTVRFWVRPCRYITYDINKPYENLYAQY